MPTLTHAPICVRTCIPLSLYTLHFKQTISIHRWTQYIRALKPHTKSTYLNWTLNPSDDWARQRAIPFVNWLCCGQVSSSYNLSSLSYSTNPWGEQSRGKNLGDVFLLTCTCVRCTYYLARSLSDLLSVYSDSGRNVSNRFIVIIVGWNRRNAHCMSDCHPRITLCN